MAQSLVAISLVLPKTIQTPEEMVVTGPENGPVITTVIMVVWLEANGTAVLLFVSAKSTGSEENCRRATAPGLLN